MDISEREMALSIIKQPRKNEKGHKRGSEGSDELSNELVMYLAITC